MPLTLNEANAAIGMAHAKAAELGVDTNAARTWLVAHPSGSGGDHT